MVDIATLGLAIDSRSTVQATKDLDNFAASGTKAASAADLLARQNAQMAPAAKAASSAFRDLNYAKEIQRQLDLEAAVAADKFMWKLAQEASQIGKTRAEIWEMKAALHGVSDGAQQYIDQIKKTEESMHKLNFSTVGARRELLVLAHEASQGQWQRFGGSLMVLGERVDAMSLLFSAGGLAAGAAAAGVGVFVAAAIAGARETHEFNQQLQLTNGYAGITKGRFDEMAISMAQASHTGIGTAKDALQGLAATGRFSYDTIGKVSENVVQLSKLTGEEAGDIVKEYAKMSDGVSKWALEHDKQYHFLTASVYDHIKSLEEQGRTGEAINATMDAMRERLFNQDEHVGSLVRGWRSLNSELSSAWDNMKKIGAQETIESKIARFKEEKIGNHPLYIFGRSNDAIDNDIAAAEEMRRLKDRSALLKAENTEANSKATAARNALEILDLQVNKQAKLNKELQETHRWEEDLKKTNPDSDLISKSAIAKREAEIRKKYQDKGVAAENNAEIDGEISAVERKIKLVETAYRDEQRIRAELRKAGAVSDLEFYAQEKKSRDKHLDDLIAYYEKERKVIERSMSNASDVKKKRLQTRLESLVDKQDELKSNKATDDRVDSIQAEAREKTKAQNIKHLTDMTNSYLDSLREQVRLEREANAIQVRAVGQGSMQTALEQKLNSLTKQSQRDDQKFQRDLDTAISDSNKAGADKDFFEKKISELKKQQEARKDTYEEMYRDTIEGEARLREAQGDWTNGAKQALDNYRDYAGNVASQTANMFQNGFRNMEDAVVNFAMTGKLNFHNFAEGVIADLIRIYVRQQMVGMLSYFGMPGFGGGGTGGVGGAGGTPINPGVPSMIAANGAAFSDPGVKAFASGGVFTNSIASSPTLAPMALFGEAGPEAIMPLKRGPDGTLGIRSSGVQQKSTGGDGIVIHTQINIASDGTAKAQSGSSGQASEQGKQLADMVNNLVQQGIAQSMRQGGLLWKMKNGQA